MTHCRRTIAWSVAVMTPCQKLLNKIGLEGKTFVTDDWEGYHRLIPDDQLFTGKDPTVPIEQDNSSIRHFSRKMVPPPLAFEVVSGGTVVEVVDLVADVTSTTSTHSMTTSLTPLAEKAAVFRAIFS